MSVERVRVRGPITEDGTVIIYANGSQIDSSPSVLHSESEQMTDWVTPNYKELIQAGRIINNPCNYSRYLETSGGGSYTAVSGGTTYTTGGNGSITQHEYKTTPCSVLPIDDFQSKRDDSISLAKAKALSRVDSTPFAFGEDVAELRETLRFLKNPVTSLHNLTVGYVKSLRKYRSYKDVTDLVNNVADVWLSYRFAATPLIRSAEDALQAYIQSELRPVPPRLTARGSVLLEESVDDVYDAPIGGGRYDHYRRESSITEDVQAGILYELINPLRDTNFLLGLRLKDIPSTAWAVIPYSFMIDRVVNLSTAVQGLTALSDPNVRILAAWVRRKTELEQSRSFFAQTNHTSPVVKPDVHTIKQFEYVRDTWHPSALDAFPPSDLGNLVKDATSIVDLLTLTSKPLSRAYGKLERRYNLHRVGKQTFRDVKRTLQGKHVTITE